MSETTPVRCGTEGCESSIAALQQALENDPDDLALHYQIGLCYSGLCQRHSLICPEVALEHLRWTAKRCRRTSQGLFAARVLALLGVTYTRCLTLPANARLRTAMECYAQAADIYLAHTRFSDWARMQFNLGNTWCEISEARHPDKHEHAIAHYERALLFRTEDADPQGYAATLENLGSTYRERRQGDKALNVGQAIHCYRRAARVWRLERFPERWAALENNLGNAYLSLPSPDPDIERSLARRAILHFDRALRVRTPERSAEDYGITQLNRAQALLRLGRSESALHLRESARTFRQAYTALSEARRFPEAEMARRGMDLAVQALAALRASEPARIADATA